MLLAETSDVVQIWAASLIGMSDVWWQNFFNAVVALVGLYATYKLHRVGSAVTDTKKDVADTKKDVAEQKVALADNTEKTEAMGANVQKIELATNSMQDKLVAATASAAHGEGVAEERQRTEGKS